jgi:hypothetical protein
MERQRREHSIGLHPFLSLLAAERFIHLVSLQRFPSSLVAERFMLLPL